MQVNFNREWADQMYTKIIKFEGLDSGTKVIVIICLSKVEIMKQDVNLDQISTTH